MVLLRPEEMGEEGRGGMEQERKYRGLRKYGGLVKISAIGFGGWTPLMVSTTPKTNLFSSDPIVNKRTTLVYYTRVPQSQPVILVESCQA